MEGSKADWRDRFLAPVVLDARVARANAQRGFVVSDVGGRFQVFAWDRSKGAISAVTSSDAAVLTAAISPDGDWIYALEENVPGSEMGHIHRIPFEGGDSEDVTPNLDPHSSYGFRATPSGVVALAGMGGRQALIVADGAEARSYELPGLIAGLAVSDDGATAAVTVATPGRGLIPMLQLMDLASGSVIATGAEMSGGGVHDRRVAVGVVDGDWMRPGIWDGKIFTRIETDIPGSLVPVDWSPDGSLILLAQSYRAKGDLFLYRVSSGELDQVASPSGARPPSDSPSLLDSGRVLSIWSDSKTARHLVEADKEHWRPALEIDGQGPFEGPEWEEFSYPSSGGVEIQGWLLRPQGTGPWPTVLYTHGGPSSVHSPAFNPICAAWFDAGFAVASVNYRGSTTFGEEFRESLTKNIGGPDIEDVVAAHRWLVESEIAIPGQIIKNGYCVRRISDVAIARDPPGSLGGGCGRGTDRRLGHVIRGIERHSEGVSAQFVRRIPGGIGRGLPEGLPSKLRSLLQGADSDFSARKRLSHSDASRPGVCRRNERSWKTSGAASNGWWPCGLRQEPDHKHGRVLARIRSADRRFDVAPVSLADH